MVLLPPCAECPAPDHHLSMNIIIWNSKGVLKPNFQSHVRDLVQNHDPAVMVVMETKMVVLEQGRLPLGCQLTEHKV